MSIRVYHAPDGNPCGKLHRGVLCGLEPKFHRVSHVPVLETKDAQDCKLCGLPSVQHYRTTRAPPSSLDYYVGIDGEGQGREDHRYTMLAWSDENGRKKNCLQAPEGGRLTTEECLDFILSIPNRAKIFAFAFGYDLTKILADLDDATLYKLLRPELRQRLPGAQKFGPKPIAWREYSLNKVSSKFIVARGKRRRVVWDTFAFYQQKFTGACEDWKVGTSESLSTMRGMKDRRAEFDMLSRDEILAYCYTECQYMAQLARKLTEAHNAAGLQLRSYYGAGSTASCILKKFGIDKEVREGPQGMAEAVAAAFSGGRFENSVTGEVPGTIYGHDISSAYPYQLAFLPCLACGIWEQTTKRADLDGVRHALVAYGLPPTSQTTHWGPFPFRCSDGSIVYPSESGGGHVWLAEYLAGERQFSNVKFKSAWIYRETCDHQPFKKIPEYYLERLRIGKEGAGIVIKLGCNSVYGKLAQSVGLNPPFQSWVWAGMVTSGTRAQILDVLALHKDPANMLMVATDGIYTREKFDMPKPKDTGTQTEHNKPLGGWETKVSHKGMFAARPGIYFPLDPTDDEIKAVRARGVGRAAMLAGWQKVIEAWKEGKESVVIANVTRFHGAKLSITVDSKRHYTRSTNYGQWKTRPIEMSFDPMPKRIPSSQRGRLQVRKIPQNLQSKPYQKSLVSPEASALKLAFLDMSEQADGHDFADYEL